MSVAGLVIDAHRCRRGGDRGGARGLLRRGLLLSTCRGRGSAGGLPRPRVSPTAYGPACHAAYSAETSALDLELGGAETSGSVAVGAGSHTAALAINSDGARASSIRRHLSVQYVPAPPA